MAVSVRYISLWFFNVCFCLRERERESTSANGGGAERGGERGSKGGLRDDGSEPRAGLELKSPQSRSWTFNRLSHPGTPEYFKFLTGKSGNLVLEWKRILEPFPVPENLILVSTLCI